MSSKNNWSLSKKVFVLLVVAILGEGCSFVSNDPQEEEVILENCVVEVSLEELEAAKEEKAEGGQKTAEEKKTTEDKNTAEDKKATETQKPVEEKKTAGSNGEPDWKKYEKTDSRLRYGGFYIMGLDHTVKAEAGDNARKIAKRIFYSEEASCYICAFNGITDTQVLEAGREIKIPKLESKQSVNKRTQK